MSKDIKNLKSDLRQVEFPNNPAMGKRTENRSKSRGREMGDQENLGLEGLSISAGGSGSGTTNALRLRQKYK